MAVSSIASSINNKIRMSGMSSGLDTDTLVKQMMAGDTAKINKVLQNRQVSLWKTDAYRDVTSSLQSFYNTYFDTLSTTNLKSASSFTSFAATYAASTSTDYISVTPGANANAGTYSITDIKAATAGSIQGVTDVTNPIVSGGDILNTAVQNISSANDNNTFVFTLDGKTAQFTLGNNSTVQDLQTDLQNQINSAFGLGKVTVGLTPNAGNDGGKLSFSAPLNTDIFSIGTAYNAGSSTLFNTAPTATSPFTLNAGNNKFELTIGGVTKTVIVDDGAVPKVFTNADDLVTEMQQAANDAFGGSADITFANTKGRVTYTSGQSVSIGTTKNGANAALVLSTANMSNKVDLNADIANINFSTPLTIGGGANNIEFTINGKKLSFDSSTTSINDIMRKINSDSSINATMKYDTTTNSFSIKSNSTGVASNLVVADTTGTLMQTLGIVGTDAGSDASVTVNGSVIVRPNNSFSYNGLTFDIKQDFSSAVNPIKVTVAGDTSKTYDFIKGFVDKYNELIDKLNTKINEKKYSDYAPLTDEQKSAMNADQITQWETKAKSGLLRGDGIVSSTLNNLRTALYASVSGAGVDLSSIGITTSSYYSDKGKLVINETKLKDALANKPEEVSNLFTNSSNVSYYDAMDSTTARSQRYAESGIAQRFSDIIQDAIRTGTNKNGIKGSLLEKAGVIGDRSEFTNVLYKEVTDFDKSVTDMNRKLTDKQNALYAKFTAMETALNKMNSQSSWITQQFGGTSK